MSEEVHPLRVVLKAILLFAVLNLLFAALNPRIGRISFYNWVFPGRLRFPYEERPEFYFVGYSVPVYQDFDAMYGAHVISQNKRPGEYRVVLLGDSATWGFGLSADQTLAEQINRLQIETCDGRPVRVYNLAYPFSYLPRDLLVLDRALQYEPDLVLWLITLSTLEPKVGETQFVVAHAGRYLELAESYELKLSHFAEPLEKPRFWEKTILGQRGRLKDLALHQALGILWAGTGIDNHEALKPSSSQPSPDVENDLKYRGRVPAEQQEIFDALMMDVISAAVRRAGKVPVLLVNEPIFIAQGQNHLVRYNGFYPRWVYDSYREFMLEWTGKHAIPFLDTWNALPPEDFSDQFFHRRESGEQRFAELLRPAIETSACP